MTDPAPEIVRRAISIRDTFEVAFYIGGAIDDMDPHPPREVVLSALLLLHYVLMTGRFPEEEQIVPYIQSLSTQAVMLTLPTEGVQ